MSLVVLQPAGGADSRQHYQDTVVNSVSLADCAGLPPSDLTALRTAFPSGRAQFWGATPAVNGSNIGKHAKLCPGDYVLFAEKGRIFSRARIRHVFRNEVLAEQLWKRDQKGQTWELMFAIDEVRDVDLPVSEINGVVGYKTNNSIQGFTVLDEPKSAALFDYLGLDGTQPPPPAPSDPDENYLPQFKPKNSSDYVTTVTGHVQTKSRRHEGLLADYGRAVAKAGFTPATNVHPRDLTLVKDGLHWLVEVKVVYNGNATDAVRAVVGQLLQYQHFLYGDEKPLLTGVFTEPIGEAYVELLEQLGIRSIWRAGGRWFGSVTARSEGLVP